MKYKSEKLSGGHQARVGVLLLNLGSPDAPTPSALRRYLAEFLWDPRVVEMSRPLWWLILHGIILRTRPKKSAQAYQSVWSEQGAPLLVTSQQQAQALQARLQGEVSPHFVVELGMRYGNPSIVSALDKLKEANVQHLVVLPLYPQYSAATTASCFDVIYRELQQWRWIPELRFINGYDDHPAYISALAKSVESAWSQTEEKDELLLFSFHGTPTRYCEAGDPYYNFCQKTARLVAEQLGLEKESYLITFQSRFGKEPWLQPYTDETLAALPSKGIKRVAVICPGFSVDCLETIEEIDVENREIFLAAGGELFRYISALNASPDHIEMMFQLLLQHTHGWPLSKDSLLME